MRQCKRVKPQSEHDTTMQQPGSPRASVNWVQDFSRTSMLPIRAWAHRAKYSVPQHGWLSQLSLRQEQLHLLARPRAVEALEMKNQRKDREKRRRNRRKPSLQSLLFSAFLVCSIRFLVSSSAPWKASQPLKATTCTDIKLLGLWWLWIGTLNIVWMLWYTIHETVSQHH